MRGQYFGLEWCWLGESGYLQSTFVASCPSAIIACSPNWPEIQVGVRMKQTSDAPSTFCNEGMIWIALEPLPMTPIFLLRKS